MGVIKSSHSCLFARIVLKKLTVNHLALNTTCFFLVFHVSSLVKTLLKFYQSDRSNLFLERMYLKSVYILSFWHLFLLLTP